MSIEARFQGSLGAFQLDAEFNIPGTGVTGLYGASGAGKSTVLRAMAGLERFENGLFRVGGETWQDARQFKAPHQRPVGYVFQEPSLFAHLDVRGNIAYGHNRVDPAERRVSLEAAIGLLDLEPLLERQVENLSGGERQRVAMARALSVSPRLLLMDEPLAALDLERRGEILPYLEGLVRELDIPVVYVSHALEEMVRLADHLVLLANGTVTASGPIAGMLTRPELPLARGPDAAALVEARVRGFDETDSLNLLEFSGGTIMVPGSRLPAGETVRLRVAARDVSLTLEHQQGTSILNIFEGKVVNLSPGGEAQTLVGLDVGGVPMLAHITNKSAALLSIEPGKRIFAQVKSVAVLS